VPSNVLDVEGIGTVVGGNSYGGVVARFHCTESKHTSIAIDALVTKDPVLYLSEAGSAIWDIRSDTSEADKFQIRYQVEEANRIDFQIDNAGNVEILTGYFGIKGRNEVRFYDNGNYVGFEAPALEANQIWVLPATDGNEGDALITNGSGALSWAAGGGGATTFSGLTDTPANYTGAENKIAKVNATPDALVFGANISDLEDVDSISGQAGKYGRVKAGDAGIEWVAGTGGGATVFTDLTDTPASYVGEGGKHVKVKDTEDALEFVVGAEGGYGKEVIDEIFDSLLDGDIHGKGVYSGWGAWNTDVEDANCSAQIVANPANGKMLRLTDANVSGLIQTRLDADAGHEIAQCLFKCKMRISTLGDTNNRAYIGMWDKIGTHTGIYFKDNALQWYTGAASVTVLAAVANTWYSVVIFMDCTAGKALIWVDGVLKLTGQSCLIQDIESFTFYTKAVSPVGGYTADFDDLLIVDLTRKF